MLLESKVATHKPFTIVLHGSTSVCPTFLFNDFAHKSHLKVTTGFQLAPHHWHELCACWWERVQLFEGATRVEWKQDPYSSGLTKMDGNIFLLIGPLLNGILFRFVWNTCWASGPNVALSLFLISMNFDLNFLIKLLCHYNAARCSLVAWHSEHLVSRFVDIDQLPFVA